MISSDKTANLEMRPAFFPIQEANQSGSILKISHKLLRSMYLFPYSVRKREVGTEPEIDPVPGWMTRL